MKYVPMLKEIRVDDFVAQICVQARSGAAGCNSAYTEENACATAMSGDGINGSHVCVEVGPLAGCNRYGILSCSTVFTPILR